MSTFSIYTDQGAVLSPMPKKKRSLGMQNKENMGNEIVIEPTIGLKPAMKKRKQSMRRVSFAVKHDVRVFNKEWETPPHDSPPKKTFKRSPPPLSFSEPDEDESMQLTETFAPAPAPQPEAYGEDTMELTESGGSVLAASTASSAVDEDSVLMDETVAVGNIQNQQQEEVEDDDMDMTHAVGHIVVPQKSEPVDEEEDGEHTRFSSVAPDEYTENLTLRDFTRFSAASLSSNVSQSVDVTDKVTYGIMAEMAKKQEKLDHGEFTTHHGFRDASISPTEVQEEEEEIEEDSFEVVMKRALAGSQPSNLDFAEFSRLAGVRFLTNLTAAVGVTDAVLEKTESMGDGEAVEELCVVLPRFENMQWGIAQLKQITQSLNDTVEGLEADMAKDNPDIYTAMHNASSEDLLPLQQMVKKLQQMENLRAHLLWHEWKLKLERNVNKTVLASFDELTTDASTIQLFEAKMKELAKEVGLASMKLHLSSQLKIAEKQYEEVLSEEEMKIDVNEGMVEDLEDEFRVLESLNGWVLDGDNTISFPNTGIALHIKKSNVSLAQTDIQDPLLRLIINSCVPHAVISRDITDSIARLRFVLGRGKDLYRALKDIKQSGLAVRITNDNCIEITCSSLQTGSKWRVVLQDIGPHTSLGSAMSVAAVSGPVDVASIKAVIDSEMQGYGWIERVGVALKGLSRVM